MVSIVIPNYNGENLIKKNLPKVIEAVGNSEIIVVDDASTDRSVVEIKKNKGVKLLRNLKNLGFSSTVNKGVGAARGEIVILLNTDVYPDKNFLKPLIKHFRDPSVFAVGCLDKSIESGKVIERGRGVGRWARGFLVHSKGEINKSNTLWASGGSSAFRKSLWQKLGGLNELYNPFYWEDIDLSYRALKSGYKVLFEKESVVFHEHDKGSIKSKYSEFQIKRIAYRNQIIFVWEDATDMDLQLMHVILLPYHLIKALIHREWAFILGFLDAFVLLPKIIQSSIRLQTRFVKGDREVIKELSK